MLRAVIYTRVSTKEQTQNLSLPVQQKACLEYCEKQGLEMDRLFVEEGESAKTADRTALKELLEHCRKNKGRIHFMIVYTVDRFARDQYDHVVIRRHLASLGISLRAVTQPIDETPTGKLMEGMLSAIAQFDNELKAEKTIAGMKAAVDRGQWPFQAPIGYLQVVRASGGKTMLPDPDRAIFVQKAFEFYATGLYTRPQVLEKVSQLGLTTRKGQPLSLQTLERVLANRLYVSQIVIPRWHIEAAGKFPPLVEQETFDRVQALLAGHSLTITPRERNHPDFPLRGFVRCEECGRPLTGSFSRSKTGKRYGYYHCPPKARCRAVNLPVRDLETRFLALLEQLTPKPEYLELFRAIVLDTWTTRRMDVESLKAGLERKVVETKKRKERLNDVFIFERAITRETYEEQLDRLNESLAVTALELHDLKVEELDIEAVLDFAQYIALNAPRMWSEASLDQKQRLQALLFPQGLIFKNETVRTRSTCLLFRDLREDSEVQNQKVSPTGFEPVSPP